MDEDDLIFLAAAILLAKAAGAGPEPADKQQIQAAVSNAGSLFEAVKKRRESIRANQPYGHV